MGCSDDEINVALISIQKISQVDGNHKHKWISLYLQIAATNGLFSLQKLS